MNTVVFMLSIWSFVNAILALYGIFTMKENCKNLSLYDNLRYLLLISASLAVIFIANLSCNYLCHNDDENTSKFISVIALIFAPVLIGINSVILNNITDECFSNPGGYKLIIGTVGILPSLFVFGYGFWSLKTSTTEARVSKQVKLKARQVQQSKLQLEEQKRLIKLEEAKLAIDKQAKELELENAKRVRELKEKEAIQKKNLAELERINLVEEAKVRQRMMQPLQPTQKLELLRKKEHVEELRKQNELLEELGRKISNATGKVDPRDVSRYGEAKRRVEELRRDEKGGGGRPAGRIPSWGRGGTSFLDPLSPQPMTRFDTRSDISEAGTSPEREFDPSRDL